MSRDAALTTDLLADDILLDVCPRDAGYDPVDAWAAGRDDPVPASDRVLRLRRQAVSDLRHVAAIRCACTAHPVELDGESLRVGDHALTGRHLHCALRNCESAVAYVVTLGHHVDALIASAVRRKRVFACVLDEAASRLVDDATREMGTRLARSLPDELGTTCRFSPGYCDWPLGEQEKLFDLIGSERYGVELVEGLLMRPHKSVSGIVGIGQAAAVAPTGNPCRRCHRTDCEHRRC